MITEFPLWIGITHYVNLLFITFLIRSGIQILSQHPRLYFNEGCTPGSEWLKFTKAKVPLDRYWTSSDEAIKVSPWIALPGGRGNLGLGRHWHFFSVIFWVLNGFIYVILLFITDNWRRLVPTSWDIFPKAWHTFLTYAQFQLPPLSEFQPYDPLQQLAYFFVVFIMAPLSILTGAAMSPALAARFPWYPLLFGGRQSARSMHFILLVGYLIFLVIHVSLVLMVHFPRNMAHIVLGQNGHQGLAIIIGILGLLVLFFLHIFATSFSNKYPRKVQIMTGILTEGAMRFLMYNLKSRQEYKKNQISPYFWVNGQLPDTKEWLDQVPTLFANYKLSIGGLVENPLSLSLSDLRTMAKKEQITKHVCIQGWSGVAQWGGVPMEDLLLLCRPLPKARYLVFYSYQIPNEVPYYGALTLKEARHPQTILAYEMNYAPLLPPHGAPLRLRVETKLGFKMTKWLKSIELVEDIRHIGLGYGGWREDFQYYGTGAEI